MMNPLMPSVSLLAKLGSIVVHLEEVTSPTGHQFDEIAMENLINDPEVKEWLQGMRQKAMLPVKR